MMDISKEVVAVDIAWLQAVDRCDPIGPAQIVAKRYRYLQEHAEKLEAENARLQEALYRLKTAADFYPQPGTDGMASRYAHESHVRLINDVLQEGEE